MTDVTVVGGGIIGLTAAVRLQQRGARVTVLEAHDPRDIVSTVAAAVWYPTHLAEDPRLTRWSRAAHAEFTAQHERRVPGVHLRETRMLLRTPATALPWWSAGDTTLRPAAGAYRNELHFTAPLAEMDVYLRWLRSEIAAAGGSFVRRTVTDLDQVGGPLVVNATGMAAARLCADPAMVPVRGHVVLVANPGLTVSVRDEDNPAGITYVHPRSRDVVLGGTYEQGRADLAPDPAERSAILARCTDLVPELEGARVLGDRIGIRPARHGGPRLERAGHVIHAYGHGGAGMTLSWGCADEIADLALGDR